MTNDNLVAEWDEHSILEVEVERRQKMEQHEGKSEEKIRREANEDQLFWEHEYECFIQRINQLLGEISSQYKTDDLFHVSGSSIGWRNQSGERILEAGNPRDLIRSITPDREFRIEAFQYNENSLEIKVYHHDSPTGELYKVRPVYATTAEKYRTRGENIALESAGAA